MEKSYSNRIKKMMKDEGWTVIGLEILGGSRPDSLFAKNKKVFLLEFKFEKYELSDGQLNWIELNKKNIYIFSLKKKDGALFLYDMEMECITVFKTVRELIDFFDFWILKKGK